MRNTSDGSERLYEVKRVWQLPYGAIGKPRQTRRDRWKDRPIIENYRVWCDLVRQSMGDWPLPQEVILLEIEARYKPSRSTPKKRLPAMLGSYKRTAPDPDNIVKAFMDAWWREDEAVGDILVRRRWWDTTETIVTMWLDEEAASERERQAGAEG
jgi:Holliday junction resolvase RusA-like endonuclease